MRILIADDDVVLSHFLEQRIREQGHEVLLARDVIQTWQSVQRDKPDLVVLDIKMPGGSGLAVLRRLKHNLNARNLPVIVITAAEELSLLQQILALRPDALMRKPFKLVEFDCEVSRLLAAREHTRSAPHSSVQGKR